MPASDPDDPGDVEAEAAIWIPIIGAIPQKRGRGPARRTGGGWEFGVSAEQVAEWEHAYPAVDVPQELKACRQWNLSKPQKRKTYSGVLSHLNFWLSDKQNKAGASGRNGNGATGKVGPPPGLDKHSQQLWRENYAMEAGRRRRQAEEEADV